MISTRSHGGVKQATNHILLIEDNMDHAALISRVAQEHPIPNQVHHFPDGQSALAYLFRQNNFTDPLTSPRPQLILLGLQLPDTDGIDILKTLKLSDEMKVIPVVVFTASATEQDIMRAYSNRANSYLVKPLGSAEFKQLMHNLFSYWLGKNIKPKI